MQAAVDLLHEVAHHRFRHRIIGDHAVAQRAHRHYVAGRASHHVLRLVADGQDASRILIDRHARRLAQHDALALHIDKHRRRAEVDADVVAQGKHFEEEPPF